MSNEDKAILIENDGSGLAKYIEVGGTIASLLEDKRLPLSGYHISVDRETVTADYVIKSGDKISVMPINMKGGE
jgi:sulfur carrier protein ThiS